MGQPPPDLWVNAKGIALAKQQAGFSQLARGSVNQQGRWTRTPCSPGGVAIKPAFAAKGELFCEINSCNDRQLYSMLSALTHLQLPVQHHQNNDDPQEWSIQSSHVPLVLLSLGSTTYYKM